MPRLQPGADSPTTSTPINGNPGNPSFFGTMPYITHAELAERPGARELAQVATDENRPVVDTELMDASLRGGDRSAWPPEAIADADDALRRIDEAVAEADSVIDGYLVKRGYTVPLALPSGQPMKLVAAWSRAITRYLLSKDSIGDEKTSPIARDYRDAHKVLQQVAIGSFSLGAGDPQASGQAGGSTDVRFSFPDPVFSRDQLKGFR